MVSFRLFAGTNVGLRDNNEDNFTVCPDLTHNVWTMPTDHRLFAELGERGCLMVVADGMGGQNAGEVASAIAIDTVQKMFAPERLADKATDKPSAIKDYLRKVVCTADINVKKYSESHPEAEGLGSTIVMAWVIGGRAYIAWLGDSRAYAMTPQQGIRRLSKDHSFVQQLVDIGSLTDIEAMNHPNSNVITRSLGDMSQKAKADVEEHQLEDGEIIILCSDGLCGVCTDDEIATIVGETADDLQKCKERLTEKALDNGGSDNITIALMQVTMYGDGDGDEEPRPSCARRALWVALPLLAIVLAGILAWNVNLKKEPDSRQTPKKAIVVADSDSIRKNSQNGASKPGKEEVPTTPTNLRFKAESALNKPTVGDQPPSGNVNNPSETDQGITESNGKGQGSTTPNQ